MYSRASEVVPDDPPAPAPAPTVRRMPPMLARLVTAGGLQALSQLIGVCQGFMLLRWLAVADMAGASQFLMVQQSLCNFVDLGISGAVVVLGAAHMDSPKTLGAYVATSLRLRLTLSAVAVPAGCALFVAFASKHAWSPLYIAACCALLVGAVWFQGYVAVYGAVLTLHQRLSRYYTWVCAVSLARLASLYLVYRLHWLDSLVMALLVTASIAATGYAYRSQTRDLVVDSAPDPVARAEMLALVRPAVPAYVFNAFAGQVTLILVSLIAHTSEVAEVAALGRLAQVFLLLGALNGVLVIPHFSRLPTRSFARHAAYAIGAASAAAGTIVLLGFVFPRVFVWVIGQKYAHLQRESAWAVAGAAIGYVSSVLQSISGARRWVWHWATWSHIGAIIAAQVLFLAFVSISQTLNAVLFGVWVALAAALVQLAVFATGCIVHRGDWKSLT